MESNSAPCLNSLQLWFAKVGGSTQASQAQTEDNLSASESSRFQATRSPVKRQEYLLSRALMRHALAQHTENSNELKFIEQQGSTPDIEGLAKNLFISLSHSNGLICFAIAPSKIGVDLEIRKQRNFIDSAKMFMDKQELAELSASQNPSRYFYRVWCAKEAYYKAQSEKCQSTLKLSDISTHALINNTKKAILLERESNLFTLAAVSSQTYEKIELHSFLDSVDIHQLQQLMPPLQ